MMMNISHIHTNFDYGLTVPLLMITSGMAKFPFNSMYYRHVSVDFEQFRAMNRPEHNLPTAFLNDINRWRGTEKVDYLHE